VKDLTAELARLRAEFKVPEDRVPPPAKSPKSK
jgi:hypothetical protein